MNTLWPILGALACPLGMLAMGGVAWAASQLGHGQQASRLGKSAGTLACNPLAGLSSRRAVGRTDVGGDGETPPQLAS